MIKLLAGKGLVQLASGPTATSSAAVTATGEVYTFGCGGDGRLGHGQIESGYVPNQDVPKHVDRLGVHARKVAVGEYHMAALGVDGSVRTWGKSRAGQLGHDNFAKGLPSPVLGLESVRVVDVGCGRQHTVAVAEDGRVFSWGAGSMGALGLGSKADQSRPQVVGGSGLGDARVVAVSCGRDFTLLLTSDGKVYGFGSDENGQLGTGFAARSHTLPVLVWDAAEARAARVLAGASHTVIITEGGQVYSFGANKDGQLGHGDRNDVGTPRLIESLRDRRIVDGAAGNAHTLLVDGASRARQTSSDTHPFFLSFSLYSLFHSLFLSRCLPTFVPRVWRRQGRVAGLRPRALRPAGSRGPPRERGRVPARACPRRCAFFALPLEWGSPSSTNG